MSERLVFVTIKGGATLPSGRPLRRAVVPVSDETTWRDFSDRVAKKLRLAKLGTFYNKEGGGVVSKMEDILDVDDLEVEEVKEPERNGIEPSSSGAPASPSLHGRFKRAADNGPYPVSYDDDSNKKYAPKTGGVGRFMQRLGLMAAPGLPLTAQDGKEGGPKRRRKTRMDTRKLLVMGAIASCLATMVLMYMRLAPPLP